jgi:hypothetical protein
LVVERAFEARQIADAALAARLPLDANVQFMTIMATKMPFVGRSWGLR